MKRSEFVIKTSLSYPVTGTGKLKASLGAKATEVKGFESRNALLTLYSRTKSFCVNANYSWKLPIFPLQYLSKEQARFFKHFQGNLKIKIPQRKFNEKRFENNLVQIKIAKDQLAGKLQEKIISDPWVRLKVSYLSTLVVKKHMMVFGKHHVRISIFKIFMQLLDK